MRFALLAWMLVAACSEYTVSAKPDPAPDIPVDSDVAEPTTKPPVADKPPVPDDTAPPQDTAPPPVEEPPPGPVDPPVADAGVDRRVAPLAWITLNGTGSYDPGGLTPLRYRWTIVRRPPGSTAVLLNKTIARPRWFVDIAGVYEVRLEVRNSAGVWDPTPDTMVVEAVPDKRFYVQLTWDAASDLDLHVMKPQADIFSWGGDACYCNKNPSWYAQGIQNPSLDWDVIDGYGPETTTIKDPKDPSSWRVAVHYYGVGGSPSCSGRCPTSEATLRYYVDGILVFTQTRTLDRQGQVWEAATVDWPSATITPVDQMTSTTRTSCQ